MKEILHECKILVWTKRKINDISNQSRGINNNKKRYAL